MSRIFDALRQSEQDRSAASERCTSHDQVPPNASESKMETGEKEDRERPSVLSGMTPLDPSYLPRSMPDLFGGAFLRMPRDSSESADVARRFAEVSVFATGAFESADEAQSSTGMGNAGSRLDFEKLKSVSVMSITSPLIVALSHERSLGAEKFRVLAARLSNIRAGTKLSTLQVTSSVVGEGKTLTSVNLAMTLATRFAQKVLLAEGDLRKPAVCEMLGVKHAVGIGKWWEKPETPREEMLFRIEDTGMCVMPAGEVAHPTSVLQSPRLAELFTGLGQEFDWVIVDTPPLLPMADSNLWSRLSDGTLLVVKKGAVSRTALKKAVESIDNPKLVGIVLNDASDYDRVNYYDRYYTPLVNDGTGEIVSR